MLPKLLDFICNRVHLESSLDFIRYWISTRKPFTEVEAVKKSE